MSNQMSFTWQKLGRIIAPTPTIPWMSHFTGPSHALQVGNSALFDIYITGRNARNQSKIGKIRININEPQKILDISQQPVFDLGELGTFDENGVSYPYLVKHLQQIYLYYIGWMPTVLTPFNLQMGLSIQQNDGTFKRYSKAPIMPRSDADYLSLGSCCVLKDGSEWKMWYTSFLKWGKTPQDHKHDYVIKYATSADGINWKRSQHICINIENASEYAICKPSVWKTAHNSYHMWYTYRGEQYRLGYAYSTDGINWQRNDAIAGISPSNDNSWDGKAICYCQTFTYQNKLYMIYNGNEYGKTGLGLAILL